MTVRGRLMEVDSDGNIAHIEMETAEGETVIGVYELIGWTTPPKAVKTKTELAIWAPSKAPGQTGALGPNSVQEKVSDLPYDLDSPAS